ncbi:MAG: cupin domain-containing protein [Burkholderiales bacterium]|jgi:quercetin dioxygenase-like cupin family protein|nr:cupin domain-containing protein [Burkholderiales bacterium]
MFGEVPIERATLERTVNMVRAACCSQDAPSRMGGHVPNQTAPAPRPRELIKWVEILDACKRRVTSLEEKMTTFRSTQIAAVLFALVSASAAYGQDTAQPVQIMPDQIKWTPLPIAPGVELAWLNGGADKPGPYVLRVHMAPQSMIPPHAHPDNRSLTVLSGELHIGFGSMAEPGGTKAFPPGSLVIIPAGVTHYVQTKGGEVVFQETGVAPTGTNWVKK